MCVYEEGDGILLADACSGVFFFVFLTATELTYRLYCNYAVQILLLFSGIEHVF